MLEHHTKHVHMAVSAWPRHNRYLFHDDVIKWKHFLRYWPFVWGIHRTPVNSPHKGQWRGALMFSLICACIDSWVINRKAGDVRRHRIHYDVTAMLHFKVVNDAVTVWIPHVCIPIHVLTLTHTLRRTPTKNTIMLNHNVETPYFLAHGTVIRRHDFM